MEESNNDIETNQSFKSPPRRRRSTFFERRESIALRPMTENIEKNADTQSSGADEKSLENLSRYYEKLLSEKEQWKNEVKSRRNKYHDLRQQYQITANGPGSSKMSYSALTNEDIEFQKAKTNITKLIDSQLKLHKSVKETRALYWRANELDNVILSHCEDKVNKINEYIFDNSTVEMKE